MSEKKKTNENKPLKEKQKEPKLKGNQKLALERIHRLFELAEEMQNTKTEEKEKYVKRYLELAKKMGEKTNTKIPKELKKKYCKKCYSMEIELKEQKPLLIMKCKKCGFIKKFGLEEKGKNVSFI